MSIDEAHVEREAQLLRAFVSVGRNGEPPVVQAVIERLRLDLMLGAHDGAAKRLYRAAVDYLEEAIEQRPEAANADRLGDCRLAADYMAGVLKRLRAEAES